MGKVFEKEFLKKKEPPILSSLAGKGTECFAFHIEKGPPPKGGLISAEPSKDSSSGSRTEECFLVFSQRVHGPEEGCEQSLRAWQKESSEVAHERRNQHQRGGLWWDVTTVRGPFYLLPLWSPFASASPQVQGQQSEREGVKEEGEETGTRNSLPLLFCGFSAWVRFRSEESKKL